MKRGGVWVDHAGATIISFTADGDAKVARLKSEAPGRAKTQGGMVGTHGRVGGASHTKPERRRQGLLQRFYQEVAQSVRGLEEVALLGPGLAKKELQKILVDQAKHVRVVAVQAADQMTEPQMIARFREMLGIPTRDSGDS